MIVQTITFENGFNKLLWKSPRSTLLLGVGHWAENEERSFLPRETIQYIPIQVV